MKNKKRNGVPVSEPVKEGRAKARPYSGSSAVMKKQIHRARNARWRRSSGGNRPRNDKTAG